MNDGKCKHHCNEYPPTGLMPPPPLFDAEAGQFTVLLSAFWFYYQAPQPKGQSLRGDKNRTEHPDWMGRWKTRLSINALTLCLPGGLRYRELDNYSGFRALGSRLDCLSPHARPRPRFCNCSTAQLPVAILVECHFLTWASAEYPGGTAGRLRAGAAGAGPEAARGSHPGAPLPRGERPTRERGRPQTRPALIGS